MRKALILLLCITHFGFSSTLTDINHQLTSSLLTSLHSENQNILFSPYSIENSLLMLFMGTSSVNEYELRHTFRLNEKKDTLSQSVETLRKKVIDMRVKSHIIYHPTLWLHTPHKVNTQYLTTVKNQFKGEIENCDLASPPLFKTRFEDWIYQKTKKKRSYNENELGALKPTTRAIFTDIAGIKGSWKFPFTPKNNVKAPFFSDKTTDVQQKYMAQIEELEYCETPTFQMTSLPLAEDHLTLLLILPKSQQFSCETLATYLDTFYNPKKMKTTNLYLQIPKFSITFQRNLNHSLMKLGLIKLFSRGSDFTPICETGSLFLTHYLHQSHLTMNEWGIEASSPFFNGNSNDIHELKKTAQHHFIADHPFLYLILDQKNDIVLFAGIFSQATDE